MTITPADSQSLDSARIRDVDTIEKGAHHQVENTSSAMTSIPDHDPNDGKLNREIILAYIVSTVSMGC